ncbi:LysR family transcriptional regulator [Thiogranum longum]|uniref:LysR family transcriptional regulator n=1 Tax=Thiogranum longum TaxID=1537524 RepID=A0A4R1HC60_9GAMM|nr:hydrogen peroxide-inducible genes activator [Thiogranum longum]TCK18133.1 LysR family transcriptional regulator [Thiogranum longum]
MNLSELRYVIALARERHFGRAAASCFVSQPTLSIAVKKLEKELGIALFERASHEVRITPAGERVVEKAQQALEAVESVRQVARSEGDQLAGPLRIGAIFTIGPYLFPDLIPNLSERAPEMPLIVEENYTAVLAEKLKQGDLDVIVISLPFDEPNILTLPLYEEPFVILLPASHPLTARNTLRSGNLEGETILMLGAGHCFRDQVIEACPACAPRAIGEGNPVYTAEGSSLETIRHMVASGMGLTVLPCTAAGADRYSQRLLAIRRFTKPAPSRVVALAWRATFPRPRVIDVVKEAIAASQLSCIRPRLRKTRKTSAAG